VKLTRRYLNLTAVAAALAFLGVVFGVPMAIAQRFPSSGSMAIGTATSVREGGGTVLSIATISDGQVLFRNGTNIDGATGLNWDEANTRLGVGTVITAPNTRLQVHHNVNGMVRSYVSNDNAGTGVQVEMRVGLSHSDPTLDYITQTQFGTGFTTAGLLQARGGLWEHATSSGTAPLVISAYGGQAIVFTTSTGRTERMRLANDGGLALTGSSSAAAVADKAVFRYSTAERAQVANDAGAFYDVQQIQKTAAATVAAGPDETWLALAANSGDITGTGLTTVMAITATGTGRFRYDCRLIYQTTATTTGIDVAINHTGTLTQFLAEHSFSGTGTSASTAAASGAETGATGAIRESQVTRTKGGLIGAGTVSVDAADTDMMSDISGFFVVSVTGDFQLQLAAESAGLVTRAMQGSFCELKKI
jgi:hypothetical protein